MIPALRASIQAMPLYEAPRIADAPYKLNQNESPYDVPDSIRQRILSRLAGVPFNRYNDGNSTALRETLATRFGLSKDRILVGAGIDELLYYLVLAFVDAGDKIVRFSPGFGMYPICAAIAGARDVVVALDPDFSLPTQFEEESRDAKVIFICRPNNPTGNAFPIEQIERIAQNTSGLVCIDEAYVDFADSNCLRLLQYDNVVLMRTFSKAFAAAAIRMGYAIASEPVIQAMQRVKLPWNVSAFSQIAAEEILRSPKPFEERLEGIKAERVRLVGEMQALGAKVYPSQANFLLFNVANAPLVFQRLLEQGVFIRSFSSPALRDCLRVTIGRREENDAFLDALKRCLP